MNSSNPGKYRAWVSWKAMKQRCNDPGRDDYELYGGRGVTYHPDWEYFNNFYADMGDRPENLSLDRIDCNGNYCKENCRYTDAKVQAQNRRVKTKAFGNNKTGVLGISATKKGRQFRYYVRGFAGVYLYSGCDFFEAVCARKSWEAAQCQK